MTAVNSDKINYILQRGVAEVIVHKELMRLLQDGKKLRIKMGFDPSRPDIHLGHVVGLRKMRQFQDLGHQVVLIVGDWTAQIGDPSGHSVTRPTLTRAQVEDNARSYLEQFFKLVDRDRTEVRWQSEWFGRFGLEDLIKLTSRFTISQLLHRDDFWKRWQAERPISLTELLYPLLQAHDSVAVNADVEVGGTDQKFNLLIGRELQHDLGYRRQECLLVPILVGIDGSQKMSKSLGNYIAVDDSSGEMFGKVMSIPDNLIASYRQLLTDMPQLEIENIERVIRDELTNPIELKKSLAEKLVADFHGMDAATEARESFEKIFQRKEMPEDMRSINISIAVHEGGEVAEMSRLSKVLYENGLALSMSDAKRLIRQGAVECNGERVINDCSIQDLHHGDVLKVGKRKSVRVAIEGS